MSQVAKKDVTDGNEKGDPCKHIIVDICPIRGSFCRNCGKECENPFLGRGLVEAWLCSRFPSVRTY